MIMKTKMLVTLRLFTVLFLAPCAQAKLNVVATTPDFGAIAREIGGDQVDVFTMAKPTEDSHFVDAKPSFVVKLNKADALIEGGAELEIGWLPPLVDQSRNPKIAAGAPGRILCNQGIALREVPTKLDRSQGDIHAAGNPHFTTDPANARIVAQTIADAFARLQPKSADAFNANLNKFITKIDVKIEEWKAALAPFAGRKLVSYHNSWPYFLGRFNFQGGLFLEPKPGIPPSPAHLAEIINSMTNGKIKIIIVEPYVNHRAAEFVASRTDAAVLDFAPYPGSKNTPDDYVGWMDSLVQALAKALAAKTQ